MILFCRRGAIDLNLVDEEMKDDVVETNAKHILPGLYHGETYNQYWKTKNYYQTGQFGGVCRRSEKAYETSLPLMRMGVINHLPQTEHNRVISD